MTPITTKIGKYHVEIDGDGDSTWCHVHDNLRDLHASLPLLQDQGGFEDDNGNLVEVDEKILDKIEDWAINTGAY